MRLAEHQKKTEAWVPYRAALCASCEASCCKNWPVEASVPDLIRLGHLDKEEATVSLAAAARRLKKEGIIRSFHPSRWVFVLAQKKNGDCIFLGEDRRCTVYRKRPAICRAFPKAGPRPGHCPYRPVKP